MPSPAMNARHDDFGAWSLEEVPVGDLFLINSLKKSVTIDANGCWNWKRSKNLKGYGVACACHRLIMAHRLSWLIFVDDIPPSKWVLHKCDNRACVNPDHLFLGTAHDNTQDMMRKGRNRCNPPKGTKNPGSKLSRDQVLAIRKSAEGVGKLADQFKVSPKTIWNVRNGHHYASL